MPVTAILVLTAVLGIYMAWTIGANDVANAMGTSVGSKALTLRGALVVAAVLEFCGAVFVGSHVSTTVQRGIVDPAVFAADPAAMVAGMMAALAAAAVWLNIATARGWPVSTTHSIVGAVGGFGLLAGGAGAVYWGKLGTIVASWIISPLVGGVVSFALFTLVRRTIYMSPRPSESAQRWRPLFVGLLTMGITLVVLFKGLKNLKLDLAWPQALAAGTGLGLLAAGLVRLTQRARAAWASAGIYRARYAASDAPDPGAYEVVVGSGGALAARVDAPIQDVERSFKSLQIATAAAMAFAHGANDVANAIGPMAAVFGTARAGSVTTQAAVPFWMLVLGGTAIVIGLATYGQRVMATVGSKITEVTPSRGFSAEFGAALTVLFGSKLGLPLSTTHTLVGSVIGVGCARGMSALNLRTVRDIAVSWLLTVPIAALLTIPLYYLFRLITG